MDTLINKRELFYALLRALLGLLFMSLVFLGYIGNPSSRQEMATMTLILMVIVIGISVLIPEKSDLGQWILFIMDVGVVSAGFFLFRGVDGCFVYFYPALAAAACARFGAKVSFGMIVAMSAIVFAGVGEDLADNIFKAAFWVSLMFVGWLAYMKLFVMSEEQKYRIMYLDQERENTELTEKVVALEKKMQSQTIVDPVTGLKNFRYFRARIEEEMARARRLKYSFSICLLEFDDAEKFKGMYGEPEWKKAMFKLAGRLRDLVRDTDLLGRYNDNQFLALFPQAESKQALIPAFRIKKAIEEMSVGPDNRYPPSFCMGISCFPGDVQEVGGLLSLASAALKRSKSKGKGKRTLAMSLFEKK